MFSIILYIITDMYLAMLTGIIVLWTCSLRTNKLWGVNHQQQDISRCYINHPRWLDYYGKVLSQENEEYKNVHKLIPEQ